MLLSIVSRETFEIYAVLINGSYAACTGASRQSLACNFKKTVSIAANIICLQRTLAVVINIFVSRET